MNQREYKIIIHSIARFIIAVIIIFLSSSTLIMEYTPRIENKFLSFLQFVSILICSIYLAHQIGMAKVKVLFTEEGFVHIWKRRFFLSREKNIKLTWDQIVNYVFEEDRTYDRFIINLTKEQQYSVNRLNFLPINDDFKKLIKDFPRLSKEFRNGKVSNNGVKIDKGESIYASRAVKWVFYFFLGGFLILLTGKILYPESGSNWSFLGIIGSAIFFYGTMILSNGKNN